jgi:tRNA pseudouridine13 synthase
VWCDWLAKEGLKSARRALRVVPSGLDWQWLGENELKLSFQLPAGSYATSVLRELVLLENEHA